VFKFNIVNYKATKKKHLRRGTDIENIYWKVIEPPCEAATSAALADEGTSPPSVAPASVPLFFCPSRHPK